MKNKLKHKNGGFGFFGFIFLVIIIILLMKYFDISIPDIFHWIWTQIQGVF